MPRTNNSDTASDTEHGARGTPAEIPYVPAVVTDWDSNADPGNMQEATDQLAERVDDNEIAITAAGDVTAAASIDDHAVVRGDGGAKGVQDTGILVDDSDNATMPTTAELRLRDANAKLYSDAANQVTLTATTLTTIGVAGDAITIGDGSEADMTPAVASCVNLGTTSLPFHDLFADGYWGMQEAVEVTLSVGGVIAVTKSYHTVDTFADAASDDLAHILGGSEGQLLVIRPVDSARSVVVKDGSSNIQCAGDFTMDNAQDTMMLIFDGSNWLELSRSNNGA